MSDQRKILKIQISKILVLLLGVVRVVVLRMLVVRDWKGILQLPSPASLNPWKISVLHSRKCLMRNLRKNVLHDKRKKRRKIKKKRK